MKLDGIRLAILTAQHCNITQAARELRISQSAASRQLKQLEQQLEIKLFRTKGRGIELTASGKQFLIRALPIWRQFDGLAKSFSSSRESLVVGASYRPSKYLLPPLMTEFTKKHPTANITLRTQSSTEIEKLLVGSKVDVAITTNPSSNLLGSFTAEAYCREPLIGFVAADHPLARLKTLSLSDLITFPVILRIGPDGETRIEPELRKLEKEEIKFKNIVRCDSPEVVKELVRLRAGVGFLYYDSIGRGIERGDFKVLQIPGIELSGQNFIVYRKDKELNSLAKEFLSLLQRSVTKDLRPGTGAPQPNRSPAAQRPWQIVQSALALWIATEVLLFA